MAARVLSVLALLMALATPPAVWSAPANAPSAATTQPKIPPAPAAKAPPPESIPVPEVARRAEEVGKVLRDFDALLVPGPAIEVIDKQLPEIAARIAVETEGTGRQLEPQPAGATLDGLTAQWQTARAGLVGYVNVLAGRATTLEAALDRLTGLRETWTRTRADARASRAPAQVIQRIDSVLTAVAASRTRLEGQRAATLVLQDRAAQEVARCEGILGRIAALRQGVAEGLLEQDGAPLWHTEQLARAVSELPERVRSAVAADAAQLRQFVRDQRWRILLPVALFIGLALLMRGARRKADLWAPPGEGAAARIQVFDRPVSGPRGEDEDADGRSGRAAVQGGQEGGRAGRAPYRGAGHRGQQALIQRETDRRRTRTNIMRISSGASRPGASFAVVRYGDLWY